MFLLKSKASRQQLIAIASRMDHVAGFNDIAVFRQAKGKRVATKLDAANTRTGKRNNPTVKLGDAIVAIAPDVKAAFQYVLKAMPNSGSFVLLPRWKLSRTELLP